MTFTQKSLIALFATTVLFCLALLFAGSYAQLAGASAPSGLQATVATSSYQGVSGTQAVLFATSSCSARIVSTASTSIMLTFRDQDIPTAFYGHFQAASTTVAYDSGQYGCAGWRVFGFAPAGGITISESR